MAKYKIISQVVIENIIAFLDEIQFENLSEKDEDSLNKINFCGWAIKELINSYTVLGGNISKKDKDVDEDEKDQSKRDEIIDEYFYDWKLPKMNDDEFEKLVGQFDAFLRGWEKEYNKKNKDNPKKKPIKDREQFKRPHVEDVAQYMDLKEIEEYLLDDPELTNEERFELYYQEHDRVQREKQRKKEQKNSISYDDMMKSLGIEPSGDNSEKSN